MIVRDCNINDVNDIAKLHVKTFDGFFMSTLGEEFLRTYYRAALKNKATVMLCAEDNGNKLGFISGCINAKGYHVNIVKQSLYTFSLTGFKLLFTNSSSLVRLVKNMTKKGKDENNSDYAEIELVGIHPSHQSKGIGFELFSSFVERLNANNVNKISLTTDFHNNEKTIIAYKKWGFEIYYDFIAYPNRRMYRLIKNI